MDPRPRHPEAPSISNRRIQMRSRTVVIKTIRTTMAELLITRYLGTI